MKPKKLVIGLALIVLVCMALATCREKAGLGDKGLDPTDVEECGQAKVDEIDALVKEAEKYNSLYEENAKYSVSESSTMQCISQNVDKNSKMYEFNYIWNEEFQPIENLNHKKGMMAVLEVMANNPGSLKFMKLLVKNDYGIRFNVKGSISEKEISNELSVIDLMAFVRVVEQRN